MNALMPSDLQQHLFHEGTLYHSHDLFGSHLIKKGSTTCTRFCVWAPNATKVSVVGDFNQWNGKGFELERVNTEGIWSIVIDEDLTGERYKYEIVHKSGEAVFKSDPYSFYSEVRPNTASIVYSLDGYRWEDAKWQAQKKRNLNKKKPVVIYELHAGSWKKHEDGSLLSYLELASELIPYLIDHGFTHIELLPLTEHPLDDSWGYQATGYFSVTSRYGTPHDFMFFVDQCHQQGIGVILDWVPGHFCKDAHGLYRFDGSYQFEYSFPQDRENVVWGTANFDLGKTEVQSFLISNAHFWVEKYHIDGFRVDAVANIIFWPNRQDPEVNELGIAFLQKFNQAIKEYDPTVLTFAEDSTDWPNVTKNVEDGGLGFSYKWNMGWMNDMLKYMETEPAKRSKHHEKVSFSLWYAFSEKFMLPFSHDEVVHGKKSLLSKMPGDYWQQFAQLRLLLGYMMAHPGHKLLFMGTELGHFSEWKDREQLDWNLIEYEMHQKFNDYFKQLLKAYKRLKPLFEFDDSPEGFEWIDVHNNQQSIFSFARKGTKEEDILVIVCNFTPQVHFDYRIGLPLEGRYREVFNSDLEIYGGAGFTNKNIISAEKIAFHGKPYSTQITIPPFGFSVYRPIKSRGRK